MEYSSPKGITALIATQLSSTRERSLLHYFPRNEKANRMRRNIQKRNRVTDEKIEDEIIEASNDFEVKEYKPMDADMTFIYFCDLNCVNSRRFTIILADFLKSAKAYYSSENICRAFQLILVPNNEITPNINPMTTTNILTHLQSETDYWCIGFDHINRLALIRMLSMSRVPTLVVISNKTGKVITSNGMEAIEWCKEGQSHHVIDSWMRGETAVPFISQIGCHIS